MNLDSIEHETERKVMKSLQKRNRSLISKTDISPIKSDNSRFRLNLRLKSKVNGSFNKYRIQAAMK